jgi:hypothetical protein
LDGTKLNAVKSHLLATAALVGYIVKGKAIPLQA